MEKSADAFRTISEVADDLSLPQHVLRFWETRFPQVRPLKRAGGRRYYRPADVVLLKTIRALLYDEGYTIKGVQKLLKEQGARGLKASTDREGASETLDRDHVESGPTETGYTERNEAEFAAAAAFLSEADVSAAPAGLGPQRDLRLVLQTLDECRSLLEAALAPPN
jgi:DNA-binding transcriptional MerR regulator